MFPYNDPRVLITLLVASSVYSVWLSIDGYFGGKQLADQETWLTVVIGVAMVIAIGGLSDDYGETQKWFMRFAVAGTPIVLRSVSLNIKND